LDEGEVRADGDPLLLESLNWSSSAARPATYSRGGLRPPLIGLAAYEDSLKELQDRLGALNDIRVHQKLVPELASGKPRTNRRKRIFARRCLVWGRTK
jgi:hypothetical protein